MQPGNAKQSDVEERQHHGETVKQDKVSLNAGGYGISALKLIR
jgi:hypothetical protein